jgi:hypothetical protein
MRISWKRMPFEGNAEACRRRSVLRTDETPARP